MATRNGKIASLPPIIQGGLNTRLEKGESATAILEWLNTNPHVIHAIRERFEGVPISPQNLSEWRNGGYLEWLVRQEDIYRQMVRNSQQAAGENVTDADEADDSAHPPRPDSATPTSPPPQRPNRPHALHPVRPSASSRNATRPKSAQALRDEIHSLSEEAAQNGDTGVRAKDLIHALNARYAVLLQDWDSVPEIDFNQRMFTLQHLTRSIAVLRRLEQNDERLDFLREKERNKSKSASSRSSRASSTAEGAPECGAGFQPAAPSAESAADSQPATSENRAPAPQPAQSPALPSSQPPRCNPPAQDPSSPALKPQSPAATVQTSSKGAQPPASMNPIPIAKAPAPIDLPQTHSFPGTQYTREMGLVSATRL